jgi:hypothetical protein
MSARRCNISLWTASTGKGYWAYHRGLSSLEKGFFKRSGKHHSQGRKETDVCMSAITQKATREIWRLDDLGNEFRKIVGIKF